MDPRKRLGDTIWERLAAVAHELLHKTRCSSCGRMARPYAPDYADFRDAFIVAGKKEWLVAKLEEARLKPANEARIKQLLTQLAELAD